MCIFSALFLLLILSQNIACSTESIKSLDSQQSNRSKYDEDCNCQQSFQLDNESANIANNNALNVNLGGGSPLAIMESSPPSNNQANLQIAFLPPNAVNKIKKSQAHNLNQSISPASQSLDAYKKILDIKKDTKLFCNQIIKFANDSNFILQAYAKLHHYTECSTNSKIKVKSFPKWMHTKVSKAWYNKSKVLEDSKAEMESAYHLSLILKNKSQKEKYLIHAMQIAQQLQDPRESKWQKKLHSLSPRYIKKPSLSQMLEVAHDFRRVRKFKKASFYYRKLLNTKGVPFHDKNAAFKWMRWIYKDQLNNKKYLLATKQWKRWLKREMHKNPKAIRSYHDIACMLVRTQWTLGKSHTALRTLNQIEKELKNRFSLFDVYRLKAFIFEELKKYNKSIDFFEKSLKEKSSNTEMREKTWWQYAWVLYKSGQITQSLDNLNNLLNSTNNQYLYPKVLFWIGRLWAANGDSEKAKKAYKKLIKKDPLSYYGFLAHYEMKKKIKIKKLDITNKIGNNKEYEIARGLLAVGEKEDMHDFLQYKVKAFYKNKEKAEQHIDLLYYMSLAKNYLALFQIAGNLSMKERTSLYKSYADILFPITYQEEVEKSAQLFNIEKELIYALIRQESAYNPKARSPSDAFGLMQVRPATAKYIAKKSGVRYRHVKDLYDPKKNILLGTAFLKKQFKRYDFQFVVTIAAYNAGHTAIRRWLKKHPVTDPLSFIENIPFEETRIYVMLLIRNFIFYKLITHPERKINFPEWILHIKQNS